MMSTKKTILLSLFSVIFCLINAQVGNKTPTKETIDSEIQKARLVSVNNPNKCIELSTKIYQISKEIDYKKGMLECDNILMGKFYDIGTFRKVIDISKDAEELAKETGDNAILSNTYRLRAASYTELGFNDECSKELKKALNTVEKIPSENGKNYQKALIYIVLSTYSAHVNAPIDSVVHYQKKCLESALLMDDHKDFINKKYYTLALSYINLGMTSVALKKAKDAETYFSKALEITENKKYLINGDFRVTILNEFAWLYYDQKDYQKAKSFAQQAEQAERKIGLPYIRRDIYEVYFKSCVELGEKEVSKKYMNLYTKLNDSIVNVEKKSINTPVKYIIDEKEEVHTKDIKKIVMAALAMIIIILLCGWFFWRRNQRRIHEKYMIVIKNIESEAGKRETETDEGALSETENKIHESGMNISQDTTTSILHKLSKFEKSERYLKKDVSLPSLAGSLNTNTRYLSELIKQHRGKNFNNYINGLRIQYITNKLYTDPVFLEYKISYLAEFCGFSSREVFAVIFKKETGVSPSYFIGQLKKESIGKDSSKV